MLGDHLNSPELEYLKKNSRILRYKEYTMSPACRVVASLPCPAPLAVAEPPDQSGRMLDQSPLPQPETAPVEWRISSGLTPYALAVAEMEARVTAIAAGAAAELIWLVEHPPLYTAGASARAEDLTQPARFEVHQTRRGGQYTYHGPGQRVVYAMLDLNRRGRDVRAFVCKMEAWVIATLAEFGVRGERRPGRVGVWVVRPDRPPQPDGSPSEDKIAAVGIRLRKWVSLHGLSINVEPDLGHFSGIVPCGIRDHGVTSLVDLGLPVTMADLDVALRRNFETVFGPDAAG
jgi:lipoyl(octanoyl) transferase